MEDGAPDALEVPADLLAAMVAHCRREAPREACGMLAGRPPRASAIYTFRNALASPTRYEADPRDLIRGAIYLRTRRLRIVALYHSHPSSAAIPSDVDLAENYYEETPRVIVSLEGAEPDVRAWRLGPDSFEPVPLRALPAGH